jgi:hypothetical protein
MPSSATKRRFIPSKVKGLVFGDSSYHWRCTSARASTHAGGDKDHIAVSDGLQELFAAFLRSLPA